MKRTLSLAALTTLAATSLLTACGAEQIELPPEAIARIDVCVGRNMCDAGKHSFTERAAIDALVKAANSYRFGWQSEAMMTLTTGWFTYPTPAASVVFKDTEGGTPLVIWLAPGWIGSAITAEGKRKRYFRKAVESEVADFKAALRIPSNFEKAPSATEPKR